MNAIDALDEAIQRPDFCEKIRHLAIAHRCWFRYTDLSGAKRMASWCEVAAALSIRIRHLEDSALLGGR